MHINLNLHFTIVKLLGTSHCMYSRCWLLWLCYSTAIGPELRFDWWSWHSCFYGITTI